MKPNSATATRPGASTGIITSRIVCQRLAPRSRAASSQTWSKRDITANITSTPNGSVQDSCAPSAEVYQLAFEAERLEQQAGAEAEHEAGRDQAADHQVEHNVSPRKRLRNAEAGHERDHHRDDGDDARPA